MKSAAVVMCGASASQVKFQPQQQQQVQFQPQQQQVLISGSNSNPIQPVILAPQQQQYSYSTNRIVYNPRVTTVKTFNTGVMPKIAKRSLWKPRSHMGPQKRTKETRQCRVNQLKDERVRVQRCSEKLKVQVQEVEHGFYGYGDAGARDVFPVCRWIDETVETNLKKWREEREGDSTPTENLKLELQQRSDRLVRVMATYEALQDVVEPMEQFVELKELFLRDGVNADELSYKRMEELEKFLTNEMEQHEKERMRRQQQLDRVVEQQRLMEQQRMNQARETKRQDRFVETKRQNQLEQKELNKFLGGDLDDPSEKWDGVKQQMRECFRKFVVQRMENSLKVLDNVKQMELVSYRDQEDKAPEFHTTWGTDDIGTSDRTSEGFAWLMDWDNVADEVNFIGGLTPSGEAKYTELTEKRNVVRKLDDILQHQGRQHQRQDEVASMCGIDAIPVPELLQMNLGQHESLVKEQVMEPVVELVAKQLHPSQYAEERERARHDETGREWSVTAERLRQLGGLSFDEYNKQRVLLDVTDNVNLEEASLAAALGNVRNLRVIEFETPGVLHDHGYEKVFRVAYTSNEALEALVGDVKNSRLVDRAILMVQEQVNNARVGPVPRTSAFDALRPAEHQQEQSQLQSQLSEPTELGAMFGEEARNKYHKKCVEKMREVLSAPETELGIMKVTDADLDRNALVMEGDDVRDALEPAPVDEFMLSLDADQKESDMVIMYDVIKAYDFMSKTSSRKIGEVDEALGRITCPKLKTALSAVPDWTDARIYEVKKGKKDAQRTLRLVRQKTEQLFLSLSTLVPELTTLASTAVVLADRYIAFYEHIMYLKNLNTKTFNATDLEAQVEKLKKINAACPELREKAVNIKQRGETLIGLLKGSASEKYLTQVYSKIDVISVEAKELVQMITDTRGPFRRATNAEVCPSTPKLKEPRFWDTIRSARQQSSNTNRYTVSQIHSGKPQPQYILTLPAQQQLPVELQQAPTEFFAYSDEEFLSLQQGFVWLLSEKVGKMFKMNLDNILAVKEQIRGWNSDAKAKLMVHLSQLVSGRDAKTPFALQDVQRHQPTLLKTEMSVTQIRPVQRRADHLNVNVDRNLVGGSSHQDPDLDKIDNVKEEPQNTNQDPKSSAVVVSLLAVLFSVLC